LAILGGYFIFRFSGRRTFVKKSFYTVDFFLGFGFFIL
jgi:hypothetical protein